MRFDRVRFFVAHWLADQIAIRVSYAGAKNLPHDFRIEKDVVALHGLTEHVLNLVDVGMIDMNHARPPSMECSEHFFLKCADYLE